jgi:hypothetical protein
MQDVIKELFHICNENYHSDFSETEYLVGFVLATFVDDFNFYTH